MHITSRLHHRSTLIFRLVLSFEGVNFFHQRNQHQSSLDVLTRGIRKEDSETKTISEREKRAFRLAPLSGETKESKY